jgi:hypothetical protein
MIPQRGTEKDATIEKMGGTGFQVFNHISSSFKNGLTNMLL